VNADAETRIFTKLDSIQKTLNTHVGRDDGLELPKRMNKVEKKLLEVATWKGLGAVIATVGVLSGIGYTIYRVAIA